MPFHQGPSMWLGSSVTANDHHMGDFALKMCQSIDVLGVQLLQTTGAPRLSWQGTLSSHCMPGSGSCYSQPIVGFRLPDAIAPNAYNDTCICSAGSSAQAEPAVVHFNVPTQEGAFKALPACSAGVGLAIVAAGRSTLLHCVLRVAAALRRMGAAPGLRRPCTTHTSDAHNADEAWSCEGIPTVWAPPTAVSARRLVTTLLCVLLC